MFSLMGLFRTLRLGTRASALTSGRPNSISTYCLCKFLQGVHSLRQFPRMQERGQQFLVCRLMWGLGVMCAGRVCSTEWTLGKQQCGHGRPAVTCWEWRWSVYTPPWGQQLTLNRLPAACGKLFLILLRAVFPLLSVNWTFLILYNNIYHILKC